MDAAWLNILIVLLLVLFNGLLSMSELAVVSARRSRLEAQIERGNVGAKAALALADEPTRFLSTVQIGITLVGILAGAFGGATLSQPFAGLVAHIPGVGAYSGVIGAVGVVLAITYLSLVVGELVPKRLALQRPETIAIAVSRFMRGLSTATAPVVALLTISTDGLLELLRIRPTGDEAVTEDDVEHLIAQATASGALEAAEHEMLDRVLDLGDQQIGSIMTPRHEIVFLDTEATDEENMRRIAESTFSAFPVCDGNLDNPRGFIALRALWSARDVHVADLAASLEQPLYVPEDADVLELMQQMRETGRHRAMVVDELGSIQGLVTINDVFEEIAGSLDLQDLEHNPEIVRRDETSWLLDGGVGLDDLRDVLDTEHIAGEHSGYFRTVGGLVMYHLGRVPTTGDVVVVDDVRFEVVDMDGRRVDKVMVTVPFVHGADSNEDGAQRFGN